jgi:uncharacterized protein YeaO (DUF488 family)
MAARVRTKRIYEEPARSDGYRVLVDRVWPRGLAKEKAKLDEWAKDLAPSSELRKWFGHDPERFDEFRQRYREELGEHAEQVEALRGRKGAVTLLYGARDQLHNNAVVLAELIGQGG